MYEYNKRIFNDIYKYFEICIFKVQILKNNLINHDGFVSN